MAVAHPETDVIVAAALPGWLNLADRAVIVLVNLALLFQVTIVFLNTVLRAAFGYVLMGGVEETSRLVLILIGFLGGAVAFGRGRFMGITILVDRLRPALRDPLRALVDWSVIVIALVIGGTSIPLQIANASETTTMLGIGYVWLTAPLTVGSLLFVAHAGRTLLRRPGSAILLGAGAAAAILLALFLGKDGEWVDTHWIDFALVALFVAQIAIGVPVGFVLTSVGIAYVYLTGAAPMLAVASNAQRGTGGFVFLALPFFILAGMIMDRGGIGSRIVEFLCALLGHLRGGLLQVLIVGMYVVSGISGSKAADMAAIGIPMTRMLDRAGYRREEGAAVLAASAAMGESIPPSIAILVLGSVTSVSTGALFLAGLLPAAVIALCLMLLVYARARLSGRAAAPRASLREVGISLAGAALPLLMPVLLIGGIVSGIGTPTEISSFAVVYGLLLGVAVYRQMGLRASWDVLTETTLLAGMIFFTFAGATVFSWALTLEGAPAAIAAALGGLGPSLFLPVVIAITIVLGALLESVVTIVILGPLLLPVATALGIHPLQYGVVLIEAFGIGSIVPPVGLALYIACAICRTNVPSAARPLLPMLAVLCAGLLLVAAVPQITLVVPALFHFAD